MKFDTTTMMLVFLFIIVAAGMWQARKMKTMAHCTYTSESKQGFEKIVREKDGFVVFEGKRFKLLPAYGKLRHYDKGLSGFFPTKIVSYDFRWNSDLPVDPNTGEPAMLSPSNMNKMRQESALSDYVSGSASALSGKGGKQGMLEKMMPIIMIVIALVVAYCAYQTYTIGKDQKVMKEAISDIYYKTGIVK